MALFFSGAVTSSPIKRRLRANHSCQSLDLSLLSPDSSYVCYSSVDGGDPSCCRRSPRLLTNGYYSVTEDSFTWDDDGNVSLTPCKTNVSYKENLVRVFRRRRRPRSSLARLLSDVTETCQSWLDEKVFRGVFRTGKHHNWDRDQDQDKDQDKDLDREYERDNVWVKSSQQHRAPLDESSWSGLCSTELEDSRSFTYDPTEIPPPPDKVSPPPKMLIQEEICSEICQSKERFTQSLGGLSEVPPPSPFYTNTCCCQASPEHTAAAVCPVLKPVGGVRGLTMKAFLLLIFTIFIFSALYSGCLWWSSTVTSIVFMMMSTFMFLTKSGPMGEWRRAKTEDITSRNE
ncbi:transmembrane protein 71 isoform X1 [Seriola dumerili]|uniref:transmembrane protein 71 isoform X1 n=1 Tax=Seriola dumerili TaxID=41447 RepID=UPI000BBF0AF6|nr:transmembrane protein 71 isoform X1 [Seriola dumerili]